MKDTGLSPISTRCASRKSLCVDDCTGQEHFERGNLHRSRLASQQAKQHFIQEQEKGAEAAGRMVSCGKYPRSHHFRRSVPKSSGADCKQTQTTEEWHNADIFRAGKMCDCGWSLAYGVNSQNKNPYAHYHCSKYGQGLRQCSMHYIRYDVLYAYVLARLQYWSMLAQKDEDKLLKRLLNASDRERNSAKKKQAAGGLKKAEKRKAEVDGLFAKMYEDSGLPDA